MKATPSTSGNADLTAGSITKSLASDSVVASRRPRIWQATFSALLALGSAVIGVLTTPATTASAAFAVACAAFAVVAVVLLSNPSVVRIVATLTGSALVAAAVLAVLFPSEGGEIVVVGVVAVMLAVLLPMLAAAAQRAAETPRPVPFVLAGVDVLSDFIDLPTVQSLASQAGLPITGTRAVKRTGRLGARGRLGTSSVGIDGAAEEKTVDEVGFDTADVHVLLTQVLSVQRARGKLRGKLGRVPELPELADHSDVLKLVRQSPDAQPDLAAQLAVILQGATASAESRLINAKRKEFSEESRAHGYQLIDAVWECRFSARECRLVLHTLLDGEREVPLPSGIALSVALPRLADGRPALSAGSSLADGMKVRRNVWGRAERLDGTILPVSPIAIWSWN